jgi:predicted Rdx family selenoprotein
LSDELKQNFDVRVTLQRGHSGIYDVALEGKIIFCKDELGRFPEEDEIVEIIEERLSR